jgi:hypothetical protein
MSDELNKKMDEALRACASERRKQLPSEPRLSDFNRAQLQKEVAAVYSRGSAASSDSGAPSNSFWSWRAWWPRIAVAAGLCAFVVISIISVRERHIPSENPAAKETVEPAVVRAESAAPVGPAVTQTRVSSLASDTSAGVSAPMAKNLPAMRGVESETLAWAEKAPAPAAPVSEPQATGPALQIADSLAQRATAENQNRPEAKVGMLYLSRKNLALANEITNLGAARRTEFEKWPAPASSAPVNVVFTPLTQFQVEEAGPDLRVIDKDGSIYSGTLTLNGTNAVVIPPPAQAAAQAPTAGFAAAKAETPLGINSDAGTVYSFAAKGTNVTLGKQVVIQGELFERTNLPAAIRATDTATAARTLSPLRARRAIVGTARIGGTNQVPLSAISKDQ